MVRWRLKEIAEPERWNPHNLAEAADLNYNTVWGIWHNRTKRADLETIDKITRVLKVEPGELLARVEEPPQVTQ